MASLCGISLAVSSKVCLIFISASGKSYKRVYRNKRYMVKPSATIAGDKE